MLDRARLLADEVLFPSAQAVDRAETIPPGHLRALADAGLFGIAGPRSLGGADLSLRETRRLIAVLAGGCGATFFVWAQHQGVVRTLRFSPNETLREELLEPMCRGELVAGVAFAHVRRVGHRAITASRVDDGWQLDGYAPWATSWGVADRFAVAAETEDGRLVWSIVPGHAPSGVWSTALALPVLGATGTVGLAFESCVVPDADVALIEDAAAWREGDRRRSAMGLPAVLGVAERAVELLGQAAWDADDPAAEAAERLTSELTGLWSRDGRLGAALAAGEDLVAEASDHRAACLDIGRRSTTALLAAVGGGGMNLDHPAQRLAREAVFYVIQAQTGDGRAATLRSV